MKDCTLLLLATAVAASTGCFPGMRSALTDGVAHNREVQVISEPPGARIEVNND